MGHNQERTLRLLMQGSQHDLSGRAGQTGDKLFLHPCCDATGDRLEISILGKSFYKTL